MTERGHLKVVANNDAVPVHTFAIVTGPAGIFVQQDGVRIDAAEALFNLADCIRRCRDDADARTAMAISTPRGLL